MDVVALGFKASMLSTFSETTDQRRFIVSLFLSNSTETMRTAKLRAWLLKNLFVVLVEVVVKTWFIDCLKKCVLNLVPNTILDFQK